VTHVGSPKPHVELRVPGKVTQAERRMFQAMEAQAHAQRERRVEAYMGKPL